MNVNASSLDNKVSDLPTLRVLQSVVLAEGTAAVATYDGGSEVSLVTKTFVERNKLSVSEVSITSNDVVGRGFTNYGRVDLHLSIQQKDYPTGCLIVDNLPSDILLGRPWLHQYNGKIDHRLGVVSLGRKTKIWCNIHDCDGAQSVAAVSGQVRIPPNSVVQIPFKTATPSKENQVYEIAGDSVGGHLAVVPGLIIPHRKVAYVPIVNLTDGSISARGLKVVLVPQSVKVQDMPIKDNALSFNEREQVVIGAVKAKRFERQVPENETEEEIEKVLSQVKIGECSDSVRQRVRSLLRKYHQVFARSKWDIGRLKDPKYKHSIKLKKDAVPKNFGHYRVAQAELAIVRKFVQKMKDAGLAEESSSQWAFPLMLIAKRDDPNERRPVVNCKSLNLSQECQATFLPKIDDLLDRFQSSKKFLTKLDCCQFYFQIELDDASKDICSFATPIGNFRSNVMLQGDANAPHKAQMTLMDLLQGIDSAFVLIDDIGLADETLEKHLWAIEEVLRRLFHAGLTLRPDKIEILVSEMTYVGFKITRGQMQITDDKIQAVKTWPRFRSITEARAFLGFTSFIRRFVRAYSELAGPLLALLKKEKMTEADWTPEVEASFCALKKAITSAPCLTVPSPENGTYHLFSDASDTAVGYVLSQEVYDKKAGRKLLKPCVFGSRLYRGAERNYSIPEKEILGCCWSIKRCRPYLFGQTFRLHTDSEATYHVLKRTGVADSTTRLARFAYDVMDYHFHVHHVRSKKNWADGLSRLPVVEGPDGELKFRRDDEEVHLDPHPAPPPLADVEIDPLWVGAVTRGQALDQNVGPGFRDEQSKDEEVQKLVKEISASPEKKVKRGKLVFKMNRGIVFAVDKKRRVRYVVPKNLVTWVMEKEHTDAHLGVAKTLAAVTRRYYWSGQAEDVADYVRGCFVCQTHKNQRPPTYTPLQDLPRPTRGQQIAAIDVKGPINPASHGKKYVIMLVDMFSRYAWTKAVPAVDGPTVVDFLVKVMEQFGRFECLISDNASNLKDGVAGFMYPELGLERRPSIPYWPSSNGAIERCIGTVGKMIRCATEKYTKWATVVQHVTSIYNGSVHRATGFAPQHLHMGYEANPLPQLESEVPQHAVETPRAYLIELQKRRADAEEAVLEGLRSYYADMKAHYNEKKNARTHKFYVGQWVLCKITRPTDSKALGPLYEGPAEVTVVTKASATVVFLNSNIKAVKSISHLKPYYEAPGEPTAEERYTGPKRGAVQEADEEKTEGTPDEVRTEEDDEEDDVAQDPGTVDEVADNGQGGESDGGSEENSREKPQEKHVHFDLPDEASSDSGQ